MTNYRASPTRAERAQAIAAVVAIHLGLAALLATSARIAGSIERQAPITIFDVAKPPPPPPPVPPTSPDPSRAAKPQGAAAKLAEPASVVAPPSPIVVKPIIPVAPQPGAGSAPSAGAALTGSGSGAGGSGTGRGGGGRGGDGAGRGGIGTDAQLLAGGLSRRDYRALRAIGAPNGRAVLAILIGPSGQVVECSIRQSSGSSELDARLCAMLQPRMRWSPARDTAGRALTVGLYYTAVWGRD